MERANNSRTQTRLRVITEALESGAFKQARTLLNGLPPADVAHLIESTPPHARNLVWALIDPEKEGEVLPHLSDDILAAVISKMDIQELVALTEDLDVDDLADLLKDLPEAVIKEVLQSMNSQDRQRIESVLSYPDNTAGGLMNTDTITVRPDVTLDVVQRYLRFRGDIPPSTDRLFVVDRDDRLLGSLSLTNLLVKSPHLTVNDAVEANIDTIDVNAKDTDVAHLFERHDLISAAVVDSHGRLLGRITIDDVVDVLRDEAERSIMGLAGIGEEDTFTPATTSLRRRAIWLGINLVTAIIASSVIGIFEGTIQQLVALAILMPIVASMGGVAGTQTLTVVIRGMALGQVVSSNINWLIRKEVLVGLLNGILWAVLIALVAGLWFQDPWLGGVIGAAIVINLLTAALAGVFLPILLRKLSIDPAIAGSVILTTFTDVVGFLSFLGLATLFLL